MAAQEAFGWHSSGSDDVTLGMKAAMIRALYKESKHKLNGFL